MLRILRRPPTVKPSSRPICVFFRNVAEVSQDSSRHFAIVESLPTDGRRPGPGGANEKASFDSDGSHRLCRDQRSQRGRLGAQGSTPPHLSIAGLDSMSAPTLATVGGKPKASMTTPTLVVSGAAHLSHLVLIRYRKNWMALSAVVKSVTIGRLIRRGCSALRPISKAPAKGAAPVSAIPTALEPIVISFVRPSVGP